MKPNPIPVITALLLLSFTAFSQRDTPLLLKSGAFVPVKNITTIGVDQFNKTIKSTEGKSFAIIQFENIPTDTERKQLLQAGIELLDYIPNNAYSVTITKSINMELLKQLNAKAIIDLDPSQKIDPELLKGNFPAWDVKSAGSLDVWISFPRSFSVETVINELKNRNFDVISSLYKNYYIVGVRIAAMRLNELASLPFIEYVEPAPHEDVPLNNKNRYNARGNVLSSSLPGGRDLHGKGVVIGIGDNANPLLHIDFAGRLIIRTPIPTGGHGIHVTGIAASAGIREETLMGYAPKATIVAQAVSNILVNAPAYVTDYGMVITNNSYGDIVDDCNYHGLYDLYSRVLDLQSFQMPHLQNVFAAGNSGYMTCGAYPAGFRTVLGGYQSAKNVISVGNTYDTTTIYPESSKGPVRDGRIKPEITAQGTLVVSTWTNNTYAYDIGTSMSAPAISGGLALLIEQYRKLNAGADPASGLMKALLCNGATDLGNDGPDYTYGFGWMNLLRSVKMLDQHNYFDDSVANTAINTHTIMVPANTAQLKVMLYWNDPAAAVIASHTLVNDLDLEVVDPSSTTLLPAILDTIPGNVDHPSVPGVDHINNVEQVVIKNPVAGTYTLRVKGTAITQNPRQEYFLVYDTIPVSTTLTYPIGNEHFGPHDSLHISWDAYGNPVNNFTVEFSGDDGATWSTIGNPSASKRIQKWFVPDTLTTQGRVRITRDGTGMVSTSEKFTVVGVPNVTISAAQCEGYISIDWTSVRGATDYEVMMLQGQDMVSVGTTTATNFTIPGLSKDSVYWVSVRARLNGSPGRRAVAWSRQPNTGNCAGSISDNNIALDTILSPTSTGRKFTSTELTSSVPVTIRIKNIDDNPTTGNITVSYILNGGTPVTQTIINPAIPAAGVISYTFPSTIDMSAIGTYVLTAAVSQSGDIVPQNDSLTEIFKQLDNPPITGLVIPFIDNMETGVSQSFTGNHIGLDGLDRYDFSSSTPQGRIRTFINTGLAYSGTKALTLDVESFVADPGNTDSLTGTFNLATFNAATDDIRLDFRYKNHSQQEDPGNTVWIRGSDHDNWIPTYDLYANQNDADGTYKLSASIEVSDLLSTAVPSQNFSSSFQVRWGQWGQFLTADNDGGAGYSFDDIKLYKVTDDIQLSSIDTPIVSSCALTAATPVKITIRNSSNTTTGLVPVEFRIDGGSWTIENAPPLAGNASAQYTFTATANLAANGPHLVEVRVIYPTDTYPDNDTLSVKLVNAAVISSFPYLENFETGNGSWYTDGKNDSWEYGTPASNKINRAASGIKAWKTHLSGNYNDQEKSYLYSPCFNISGMTAPTLSFSLALDLEDCAAAGLCDGAYMEYSRDGKTWTRLGATGQGTNWYNRPYAGNNVWSVQDYNRWHVATIPLPTTGLLTQLRLRFVVAADQSVNKDGIAVDDIHIYDNVNGIYSGPTMATPVTQNITGGTGWIDFLSGGQLVASVQPNNQVMGNTNAQAYIFTGPVRNNSGQYYHNRNITIEPEAGFENLADSALVRFYFLDTETEALINATGCGSCAKPSTAYDLGVSKYSDPDNSFENGMLADDNQGTWKFINSPTVKKVPFDKGYYAEFKVRDFSEFWLNNGGFTKDQPLPVQLIDFTARKQTNKNVMTNWTTATEFNVNRFEVEVARGNTEYQQNHFSKIGQVNSAGNSTNEQHYAFVDAEANKNGVRYYRLKIVENDGAFHYSAIRPVVFDNEIAWQVYPNPSTGLFNLSYQADDGATIVVKVYDANGKVLSNISAKANGFVQKINVDLRHPGFASGLYLLEATVDNKKQVFRLVKQ